MSMEKQIEGEYAWRRVFFTSRLASSCDPRNERIYEIMR
jgi:hypothetical protein